MYNNISLFICLNGFLKLSSDYDTILANYVYSVYAREVSLPKTKRTSHFPGYNQLVEGVKGSAY